MIVEKKTKSGRLLDVDFYPAFSDGRKLPTRAPKEKPSTAEQERYNRTQAVRKLVRLVNTNFDTGDIIMHPTYLPDKAPQSEKEARRDVVNYLRRVKTKRRTELLRSEKKLEENQNDEELLRTVKKLSEPLKYIYVLEKVTYKSGKYAGRDNWHFHLLLTGGIQRDVLEDMWRPGMRTNADRFQPDRFGPEAAAKYMAKAPMGSKRFVCSQNLTKPTTSERHGSVTRRGVEKLAKERQDDSAYWENRYKGYRFIRCFPRYNGFNGHWYLSVIMYRTGTELPDWQSENWIT